jgi:hypothetical protein
LNPLQYDVTGSERFTGADTAWLRMETPESPMVITAVLELGSPILVEEVRAVLVERLLPHARFRSRIVARGGSRPWWDPDPAFTIERHVHPVVVSSHDLPQLVADLAGSRVPRGRPPWEIHVVERYGDGAVIVCSLHHSIADGISLMEVLLSLCDGPDDRPAATIGATRTSRMLGFPGALARLALRPPDPPTPLRSALTGEKRVAWATVGSVERIGAIAAARGVSINDVLLASVGGALRHHLDSAGSVPRRDLKALVPFNVRSGVKADLGNRFGMVLPVLGVNQPGPDLRLRRVHAAMGRIKDGAEGPAAFALISAMGFSGAAVQQAIVWFFARKASAVITNVAGPRSGLTFAGRRIDRIVFWVPQAGGIGLGISLLSYAGEVTVGVLADTGVLADPEVIVEGVEREFVALDA